jgi:hypothetical protein
MFARWIISNVVKKRLTIFDIKTVIIKQTIFCRGNSLDPYKYILHFKLDDDRIKLFDGGGGSTPAVK